MSLNPTEASKTPTNPLQPPKTGDGSIMPSMMPAPNTLYAYIRGPTYTDYMPEPAAKIEFFALKGTMESLAGSNEQRTARKAIMMRNRVGNSVQRDLSQWALNYMRSGQDSSQRPCDTKYYNAWEKVTLNALGWFAEEHNTGLGEDGTRFKIVRDAEELAELRKGGLQKLSCDFQNLCVQSTRASTNG